MKVVKYLLFAGLLGIIVGCKIAVIVVEGGEVVGLPISPYTCIASEICIVDVNDPYFTERFRAVPDTGWYFQGWRKGDGFLCGGSSHPGCYLSFRGFEHSQAVEDMVASSEMFYIMPVFKQFTDTITVDGKQWYQPYFFTGLSWEDINAVCPAGECAGVLNGYDMTGWTWASIEDFNALVNYYIGREAFGPGPRDSFFEPSPTAWASAFYSDGWRPTIRENYSGISGWLRKLSTSGEPYSGGIGQNVETGSYLVDVVSTGSYKSVSSPESGGWFYRAP